MISSDAQGIKDAIKALLKKGGYRYEDLAAALGVSLPTVRRFLTKEDLSLDRLAAICRWLGVSLKEVVELAERRAPEVTLLTVEQEEFFAAFPHFYRYLSALGAGMTPPAIAAKYELSAASTERYLSELEAWRLVERAPSGAVRLLIKWPANWRFPGPLQAKFGQAMFRSTVDHLEKQATDVKRQPQYGKDYFFFLDMLTLTESSYREYVRELVEIYRKYTLISRFEAKTRPAAELSPAAALLGIDRWNALAAVLGDVKNLT